ISTSSSSSASSPSDNSSTTASSPGDPAYADYNGVQLVQAFGDAPNAPAGRPSSRQVSIYWPEFTGATAATKYGVYRVRSSDSLDLTVNGACSSATVATCLVCTVTGAGGQSCTDTQVGAPPAKY